MTDYATPAELAAWIDPDTETPPAVPNATILLRSATGTVLDAIDGAVFDSTDGVPTDATTATAIKSAVLQQAADLSTNGIDPRKADGGVKAEVASKSLGGMSVSYVANTAAAATRGALAAGQISPAAWGYLQRAGLITTRVDTAPYASDVYQSDTPIDPLSGRLIHG